MTNDEIITELKRAFPTPDYGVGIWDYDRQFRVVRMRDGRVATGWFDPARDAQNLNTAIANCRSRFGPT